MSVIEEIAAERRRQVEGEDYRLDHDDMHVLGELAEAAACYALSSVSANYGPRPKAPLTRDIRPARAYLNVVSGVISRLWPWHPNYLKPKDQRRDLIRAGALIVAEIERLDRAAGR